MTAYGAGSRSSEPTLGRDQIIDVMRYLGWITHDQQGNLTDEAYAVASELTGKVCENVMLSTWIAQAVARYRAKHKEN